MNLNAHKAHLLYSVAPNHKNILIDYRVSLLDLSCMRERQEDLWPPLSYLNIFNGGMYLNFDVHVAGCLAIEL
jgi:hypothetical protein